MKQSQPDERSGQRSAADQPSSSQTQTSTQQQQPPVTMETVAELPWGGQKLFNAGAALVDAQLQPGRFAAQSLLVDFVACAERKLHSVTHETLEKHLSKTLQRGEDPQFDNLLRALNGVSEHCLPSVLKALFLWYDSQQQYCQWLLMRRQQQHRSALANAGDASAAGGSVGGKQTVKGETTRDYLLERRLLAVDFIFCLVLIEVLPQLYLHPGNEEQIDYIIQLAFRQFKYKDATHIGPNISNAHTIADLYAEVIGVLSQSRFRAIRKRFTAELNELRATKEQGVVTTQNIIGILMGMKFFRVKTNHIEELEYGFSFLHELGQYFLEVKDRDIKHSIAGLLVELLLAVAGQVKTETNIPSLISFVELLYSHTLDLANRRNHKMAAFPLLTCLLCISQTKFFLTNWLSFLTLTLSNLRSKDQKMARVALESLYRLLWVYVIRIGCESNTATISRLQSICNSLFPRGGRGVIPRDAPLNIFTKIIQFIAQEKLDFAFKEIIFDLLCVGRQVRGVYPERMNIGVRALMVIADGLQQKDGPPGMPRSIGPLASGTMQRIKKTYLTRPLTQDVARSIGLDQYYAPCRRAFDNILRALDLQVGRSLMLNVLQSSGKEPDDLMSGERKPKLELFRTCIAAIPRLLPDGMSHNDLIDLICRMTVHTDEELRGLSCQTLQNLITECPDWREDVIHGLLQFITRDIQDSYPQLLDNSLRLLLQLISTWKNVATARKAQEQTTTAGGLSDRSPRLGLPVNQNRMNASALLNGSQAAVALHCVEGMALVMVCQGRIAPRRLATTILKEVRTLLPILCNEEHEEPLLDVLDQKTPEAISKYVPHISDAEKAILWPPSGGAIDFMWAAEKIPQVETDFSLVNAERGNEYLQWDAWACALSGFTESALLTRRCPTATLYAWPIVYGRLTACFQFVDPNNPQNDTRASLLRSSKSKQTAISLCGEQLNYNHYLSLWQKYLVLGCALAPPAVGAPTPLTLLHTPVNRSLSPVNLPSTAAAHHGHQQHSSAGSGSELVDGTSSAGSIHQHVQQQQRFVELRLPRVANVCATNLFKWVVPLLKCEMTDMRDIVVLGLASVSPPSFECLLDELIGFLRDAAEKKQENIRRRRRRDLLRLQLIRLLEVVAFRGTLPLTHSVEQHTGQLKHILLDFVDNARQFMESDQDRDVQIFNQMKLHFAKMIYLLINSFPTERRVSLLPSDRKQGLFVLFTSWCSRLGLALDRKHSRDRDTLSWMEQHSVKAMCAVLCCGPVFETTKAIGDDGYLYGWLDALLTSQNDVVDAMSGQMLGLLLDFNAETGQLLDWLIDRCYTTPARVADKCFRALATVFAQREYPCDIVSMLALTLMYAGYPENDTQQLAVQLLRVLERRFFFGHVSTTDSLYASADGGNSPALSSGVGLGGDVSDGSDGGKCSPLVSSNGSQLYLSQQLAELHPEMTVPILSEVSMRLETARPARQAAMLRFLIPWVHNIELVDPNIEPSTSRNVTLSLSAKISESHALARRILKGEGWGSPQATELVLNNLMYLTIKFGNEHSCLLEQLWAALVTYWPLNLRVILRYLAVTCILSPDCLLSMAKRIAVYLGRVNPERTVEELINELQTIDTFRCPLERQDMPPFYRWARRLGTTLGTDDRNDGSSALGGCGRSTPGDADGLIHTRRHTPSASEPVADNDANMTAESDEGDADNDAAMGLLGGGADTIVNTSASMASLVTLKADVLNGPRDVSPTLPNDRSSEERTSGVGGSERHREYMQPFQLPMPAYGGHYCPLERHLPRCDQPIAVMQRSNIALILLTDFVIADVDVEWTVHLPLILHMAVLGLDHGRSLINDHCKTLLANMIVVHSTNIAPLHDVAQVLLSNRLCSSQLSLASSVQKHDTVAGRCFDTISSEASTVLVTDSASTISRSATPSCVYTSGTPSVGSSTQHVPCRRSLGDRILEKDSVLGRFQTTKELVVALLDCLTSRMGSVMWPCEDVSAKIWTINSGAQLFCFVSHLGSLFSQLLPAARVESRWAQTALQLALSCSNRHLAGRSFQTFRALRNAPTSRMLSDVLSRLVETVGEQSDDMLQGYVTEILLTLDVSVVNMEMVEHSVGVGVVWRNVTATTGEVDSGHSQTDGLPANQQLNRNQSPTHMRSTSYSAVVRDRMSPHADRKGVVSSCGIDELHQHQGAANNLPRSKSAQVLKSVPEGQEEHLAALSQLCWIAVSMLESDLDHEYCLALRLVDRIVDLPAFERQDCFDRLDRMTKQLGWNNFPGLLALVLKSCQLPAAYDFAIGLMTKLLPLLDQPMVDPDRIGLPAVVIALLPQLVLHYEQPTKMCALAADTIAECCAERLELNRGGASGGNTTGSNGTASSAGAAAAQASNTPAGAGDHPLDHLSMVMRLYSKRSFSRDGLQWTKCVVKYLHDACWPVGSQLLVILTEMLERGTAVLQLPTLQIIFCVLNHIELAAVSPLTINGDVLKAVARHIQGVHWREASRIMKLAVIRSSSFHVLPPSAAAQPDTAEPQPPPRRELPGRTMEFDIDMAHVTTTVMNRENQPPAANQPLNDACGSSPRKVLGATSSSCAGGVEIGAGSGSLRRALPGQVRVREHLVSLLNASGLRVGLPKSPSVIFSQTSNDLAAGELPSSAYSSSGELTAGRDGTMVTAATDARPSTPSPEDSGTLNSELNDGSFPRVFKEFDFLEAERDSVSESVESGFNFYATMRPRSLSESGGDRLSTGGGSIAESRGSGGGAVASAGAMTRSDDAETTRSGADSEEGARTGGAGSPQELELLDEEGSDRPHDDDDWAEEEEEEDEDDTQTDRQQRRHSRQRRRRHTGGGGDTEESEEDDGGGAADAGNRSPYHPSAAAGGPPTSPFLLRQHRSHETDSSRPTTPASISVVSIGTPSLEWASLGGGFPGLFALECNHHSTGQIEEGWQITVSEINNDTSGSATANATLIFTQLYREACAKASSLVRDASHFLSMSEPYLEAAARFRDSLDILMKINDCPFLFLTAQLLRNGNFLQRQKFTIFELREHHETFQERRENCIRTLNGVKSSLKLRLLGQKIDEHSNQEVELCKSLHKLLFQLLLMCETFCNTVQFFTDPKRLEQGAATEMRNLSVEVLSLQKALLCSINEIGGDGAPGGQSTSAPIGSPPSGSVLGNTGGPLNTQSMSGAIDAASVAAVGRRPQLSNATSVSFEIGQSPLTTLVQLIQNRETTQAVQYLRKCRAQSNKVDMYGCCEEEDVEVLLLLFCRAVADSQPHSVAVLGSACSLLESCERLREANLQLSALVRQLPTRSTVRSTRSSQHHLLQPN